MQNNFVNKLIWMKRELEALKMARLRDAGVLRIGSWTGTLNFTIVNYWPTKTARITITPTTSTTNMLTSVYYTGAWNGCYFRILRTTGAGNSVVYYVSYLSDQATSSDRTVAAPIIVNFSAPANVFVDYVDDIYSY